MSDILIRGMEMPQSCAKCPFEVFGDCYGGKVKRIMDVDDYTSARAPQCPLLGLPPHGDLCDRSVLLAQYDAEHVGAPGRARRIIEEAPVVVPAERRDADA